MGTAANGTARRRRNGIAGDRTSGALASVWAASGIMIVLAIGGQLGAGGLPRSGSPAAPALQTGDFVDFTCAHATITLNGSSVCHDQSNYQVGFGPAGATTGYNMSAIPDVGYSFSSWSTSAVCLGDHPTCATSGSTFYLNAWAYCAAGNRCSGTVTVSTGSASKVNVAVDVFVNWTTNWVAGQIEECQGSSCATYSNGQTMSLYAGDEQYTVTAVSLNTGYSAFQWLSSAGPVLTPTADPAKLVVSGPGTLSLVVENPTASNGWAVNPGSDPIGLGEGYWGGYAEARATSLSISSASAEIQLPTGAPPSCKVPDCSYWIFNAWVGLGGVAGQNMFAVGVSVAEGAIITNGYAFFAWWEEVTPNCGASCPYGASPTTFYMIAGQTAQVSVTVSGGSVLYSVEDLSNDTYFSGAETFAPSGAVAVFMANPTLPGALGTGVLFSHLEIDGSASPLEGNYLAAQSTYVHIETVLKESGGYPEFKVD